MNIIYCAWLPSSLSMFTPPYMLWVLLAIIFLGESARVLKNLQMLRNTIAYNQIYSWPPQILGKTSRNNISVQPHFIIHATKSNNPCSIC
ncbi:hypothetical protein V8B97DRAFT_1944813 [Scleroderma yunnanense]